MTMTVGGYPYSDLFPKPCSELLALVVPHAQSLLEQSGNFLPFAAVGVTNGVVEMVRVDASPEDPDEMAWTLLQSIGRRVDAGEVVSAAQCSFMPERDMVWGSGAGVSVLLEARGHPAVLVMLSCRRIGGAWVLERRPMLLPGTETLFAGSAREKKVP